MRGTRTRGGDAQRHIAGVVRMIAITALMKVIATDRKFVNCIFADYEFRGIARTYL